VGVVFFYGFGLDGDLDLLITLGIFYALGGVFGGLLARFGMGRKGKGGRKNIRRGWMGRIGDER